MNTRIIEDRQIQHRASEQGPRITRVQRIEVDGRQFIAEYWHDWQTMKLITVTSREVVG